jgi:hypothetical protein
MMAPARTFGAFLFFLFFSFAKTYGQSALDTPASLHTSNAPIPQALVALGKNCGVELAFSERFFDKKQKVNIQVTDAPVRAILEKILEGTGIGFREVEGQIVLFLLPKQEVRYFTLSGYVQDAETGERLIAAAIFCPELGKGTVTNEYGFYSLTLPDGTRTVRASYIGYNELENRLPHQQNQRLDLHLQASLTLAEIIVVPGEKPGDLLPSPTALKRLKPDDFKAQPDLGGQSDLLRTLHMLPGVQSGADGMGGMFIRGGNSDQNLVLLDGVPVYNPDHLMGLFSIFNTSSIRSAKLLKGGFPARYGGRLSSVLDVYTKEGNLHRWSGEAGSDIISAKAMVEGPFAKENGSLMLSGRRTHSDFYLQPATLRLLDFAEDEVSPDYHFYDLNAKLNYSFSKKDKLFLSFYKGNDGFRGNDEYILEDDFTKYTGTNEFRFDWGNTITSLRWNRLFNQQLFSNTTLTYSHFNFSMGVFDQQTTTFIQSPDPPFSYSSFLGLKSDIRDMALKTDVDFSPLPNHYLRFGMAATFQQFRPNLSTFEVEDVPFVIDSVDLEDLFGAQSTRSATSLEAYIEDELRVGERWLFNLGLRLSSFSADDKNFFFPEPRLSAAFLLNKQVKVNASISRTVQYLHRLATLPFYFPADYWLPSGQRLEPQRAWQATLGLEGSLQSGLEFNVEGFYKTMRGLASFPDTFYFDPFFSTGPLEESVVSGSGTAYGLEFLLRKQEGRTGGWLGYGLTKSTRQFEQQNGGQAFPFAFDRRHELKFFLFRRLGEQWQASLNWHYGSPNPQVITDSEGEPIDPGTKNRFRSTAYHRLDLALSFSFKTGRAEHLVKASIYNLYNRKNVAFYRANYNDVGQRNLDPVHLFGVMPGLFYGVKF